MMRLILMLFYCNRFILDATIVFCFTIFIISKKYRWTPHCITTGLLIQSFVAPLVAILYSYDVIPLYWKVKALS